MTLTRADLPSLSFDQLATAYTITNRRALDAPSSHARARALALRMAIDAEARRRDAVITRLADGRYHCGHPERTRS